MSNYDAPASVEAFSAVPRFGHSSDLVGAITNQISVDDYARGCVFSGAFILAVFLFWVVLSALFFCCGNKTVGILSGRRIDESKTPKHTVYRSLVLVSCILSLMSGVTFLVKVSSSLEGTFDSVRDGIEGLSDLARNVTNIADSAIRTGEDIIPIRDTTVTLLEEGICSTVGGGTGVYLEFNDQALAVAEILTELSDFSQKELVEIRNNFDGQFKKAEDSVNSAVDTAEDYARVSYYAIAIIILTFFLSLGSHLAWHGPRVRMYFFIQSWLIIPIYFLILILTVIGAAALSAALVVNSDVCLPSPNSFVKGIADSEGLTGYPRQVIDHYIINSCEGNFEGITAVKNLLENLNEATNVVTDLEEVLDANLISFQNQCLGNLDGFYSSVSTIALAMSSMVVIVEDTKNLLECQPINVWYEDFFYGGVCTNLPNTMLWMFVTMMLVVTFGMLIFTLRGALVPSKKNEEPENFYYTNPRKSSLPRNESQNGNLQDETEQNKDIGDKT